MTTCEFDSYTGGENENVSSCTQLPEFFRRRNRRISGPGRREIGHGALAERSIASMIPLDTYPYAVRVVSEIMESNGSTSMASVCGGTLALLDAGVPMIRPVAGISVGICTEYAGKSISKYQLLTDIIGWKMRIATWIAKSPLEQKGITGFQLDLKLKGIPHAIMAEAVENPPVARLAILAEMAKTINERKGNQQSMLRASLP